MVSIGDGLRMMQGGVDRTGYADMADAIGNPGLDLIKQRRAQAEQEAKLQALLDAMMLGDGSTGDGSTEDPKLQLTSGFNPDTQMQNTFPTGIDNPELRKIQYDFNDLFNPGPEVFGVNAAQFAFPQLELADVITNKGLEELDNLIKMGADPIGSALYLSKGATIPGLENELGLQDGGRVHLKGGGMDAGAGSLSGDRGFGAGVSRGVQDRMDRDRGGNKQGKINLPNKEVDIDQLQESMPTGSNYTGMTNIDPKISYSIGSNLMQMQPPVADEASAFDQVSKYNPFAQTFDVAPGLTFGYDIDPNLKDLSDLSAQANLTYSFNQGGNVSGKISDDEKSLRLSDEDKFIQAQTVGDTDLYDYLIGGEITPGLNFELGLMDDAIMEPGMTSPDDFKFFRLIKEF